MSKLKHIIDLNPRLKKFIHFLLIPTNQARPRRWVRWIINPLIHKHGKNTTIRSRARLDVLPFNEFKLGNDSIIEDFATINNGMGPVIIKGHSLIGISSVIIGPVTIGNNVILAQNIVVSGLNHNYEDIDVPIVQQNCITKPILIEDDCWIGANSVITAGVRLGKHSVVGAGSVVTKDVPPFSVVAGNPAKIIKQYNTNTKHWEKTTKLNLI